MHLSQAKAPASIALKAAMAISGALMALWLTLHMLAIQLVFAGPTLMNAYALKLRATGLLVPMRVGLLALLAVHVVSAALTTQRSWEARPVSYARRARAVTATLASRTMRTGGVLLLLYVAYHVGMMYGVGHPTFVPGDVHHNLIAVLRSPLHASLYTAAALALSLHLAHGLESALRSLGYVANKAERRTHRTLQAWAWVVSAGFAAPPLYYASFG